jgi:uncharacterized membrane protein required for colicin V production
MNIVDMVMIGIIALSVLWGFYRGFIQSVLSMGACLLSFLASFWAYPYLAGIIQGDQSLVMNLIHYTDASSRIGNLELAMTNVGQLTQEKIAVIIGNVSLPQPLSDILGYNLENGVFQALGVHSVSDYVNQTIMTVSVNILSFLICFAALYVILSLLLNVLRAVFHFPLLKQFDWLAGGAFGALRGVIFCYAAFVIVPLALTVMPVEGLETLIAESALAGLFNNGNLILAIMNRRL